MSRPLSLPELDDIAAAVIADVQPLADELARQPFFESLMAEVEKRPACSRRYTGAEFFLRAPDKFKQVCGYLAEGRGLLWIADRVNCSHHTVAAVRDHFPKSVAIEKQRLSDLCEEGARLMVEKIVENPEKVPPQAWAITAGCLIDKAAMLRGGPSVTIEHRHTFSHADFNQLVDALPIEAVVMGESSGNLPQIACAPARPPAGDPPTTPAATTHDSPSVDNQSVVSPAHDPRATADATPEATGHRGGGGPRGDRAGETGDGT